MLFYKRKMHYFLCLLLLGFSAGVVAGNPDDPWEGLNRKVFSFNDALDRHMLKPVAKGYKKITPRVVDDGLSNMYSNLGDVITLVNDLLQLNVPRAGITTSRILINSTVGLFGFFDVASKLKLVQEKEDFGQTLQFWGVPKGPYLMIPLYGPSTVTDVAGLISDSYLDPSIAVEHIRTRNSMVAVDFLDRRADLLKAEELITGDKYVFIRDAYLQRRASLLNNGLVEDDFGNEDFEDF